MTEVVVEGRNYTIRYSAERKPSRWFRVDDDDAPFSFWIGPRYSETIVGDGIRNVGVSGEVLDGEKKAHRWEKDPELMGNVGVYAKGLPGDDESDITGLHMDHFHVQDGHRRKGVGTALFDVYLAQSMYFGGTASGKFGNDSGGGHEFLRARGVPAGDIKDTEGSWVSFDAVYFETEAETLFENNDHVRIERD